MTVSRRAFKPLHGLPLLSRSAPLLSSRAAQPRTHALQHRRNVVSFDATAGAQQQMALGDDDDGGSGNKEKPGGMNDIVKSVLGTALGILLIGGTGIGYHFWYKWDQLRKMRIAFEGGYDPVLELAKATTLKKTAEETASDAEAGIVRRSEQEYIDKVINGEISGEYVLLLGPKGVGKSSMIIDAMIKNDADGVALCEAHEDPDILRLRLGKALNFEFNEDSFAGLFQMRDIKEGSAVLDCERALNKLEKVAIRFRKERGRPIVLIFNNIHFIHDDEEGHALLHMIQQRAEAWAQSHVCTCIFSADNFVHYPQLKRHASRMQVITVRDLTPYETHICLSGAHRLHYPKAPSITPEQSLRIWNLVGGRLSILGRISRQPDMEKAAKQLVEEEKQWLLHKYGLIPDHDDDVMDEQKVASCSFLLFQEFAKLGEESAHRLEWKSDRPMTVQDLENVWDDDLDVKVTYGDARVIMTRTDYMVDLDVQNVIKIDASHMIRPDSRLMLSVFRDLCKEKDFQERLDTTRDRVSEIESLGRTRELTVKKDNDLGGFLRLRVGELRPEHEKDEDEDAEEDDKDANDGQDDDKDSVRQTTETRQDAPEVAVAKDRSVDLSPGLQEKLAKLRAAR